MINGVQLKCDAEASCIVDPALVLMPFGHHPALADYRLDHRPTPLTLAAASLSVGKPVDPALFFQAEPPR